LCRRCTQKIITLQSPWKLLLKNHRFWLVTHL
jgi:hypothetical protein